MEIDDAVKSVVALNRNASWSPLAWVRAPEPVCGSKAQPCATTLGQSCHIWIEPVNPWDWPRPIPGQTMISIQLMKLTGAAILVSRGMKVLQAALAA